jgi:diacylglycerol kinase family enzyme
VPDPRAAALIFNPVAGRIRSNPGLIERLAAALRRHGPVELSPTTGPRTAGPIAREAIENGAPRIYIAGGDGTVNEVAAGVAGTGVPLCVLPAGTANVFCMETGLGRNPLRVAGSLSSLVEREIALGSLETEGRDARLFLCMAGIGLDARIVRFVSPAVKQRFGKLSYWQGGFAQLGKKLEEFDIRIDGRQYRSSFALVARVSNYGGDLDIARHANLLTDDFAIVLFEGPGSLRYLKYFSGVLLNRLGGMNGVTLTRARSVEIAPISNELADLQVDGEHAGFAPARVSIAAPRLRVLLPRPFIERMEARLATSSAESPSTR